MPNNEDSKFLVPWSDGNFDVIASLPEESVLTAQWEHSVGIYSVAFSPDGR